MNKELLANIRNILIPTLASRLKKTNYEGQGEKDAIEFTHDITEIFDLAEQQLSAQPRWIPVTERLPKNGQVVLITNDKGNVSYGKFRGVDFWKNNHVSCWTWKGNTGEYVLAWMPRPEPWKGER